MAEKNGWLSDTRTTAAIVYRGGRATIVVVELYRPGVTYAEAKQLGRRVLRRGGSGVTAAFVAWLSSACFSSR